jgi:glycosyltransferase involved in cell wall biosynthesis
MNQNNENVKTRSCKPSVVWCAPLLNPSGYCSEALSFAVAMGETVDLELMNTGTIQSPDFVEGLPQQTRHVLLSKLKDRIEVPGKIVVQHMPGNGVSPLGPVTRNVVRTMFETDRLPADWVVRCNQMDEVWVPSRFNLRTFARSGVHLHKIVVLPGLVDEVQFDPDRYSSLSLLGRSKMNFLAMFEWSPRKGWDVLLSAYLREFSAKDDVCLHLRTYLVNEPDKDPAQEIWQRIRSLGFSLDLGTKPWPRIEIISQQIPTFELPRLYKAVDCLVAPSRGEGWGRPQHEAMMMGLPVIATNWSGNTEFMNKDNSYLLDYELTVASNLEPCFRHYQGHIWANPSEPHLRFLMRHIQQNLHEAQAKGREARSFVLEHFSRKPVIAQLLRRLGGIAWNGHLGIMDVSLESATSSIPNLAATVGRVNRYLAEGRTNLALRIVKKELGSLPESGEIFSRIKNAQPQGTQSPSKNTGLSV